LNVTPVGIEPIQLHSRCMKADRVNRSGHG
jgi:hypothetical protein